MKTVGAWLVAVWLVASSKRLGWCDQPQSGPDVVQFLVDDMGWIDCGVYGLQYYQTPQIDPFAKWAMRFTDAHAQPLCWPYGVSPDGMPTPRNGAGNITDESPGEYIVDRQGDEAIRFLRDSRRRRQPFFLNPRVLRRSRSLGAHAGVHG